VIEENLLESLTWHMIVEKRMTLSELRNKGGLNIVIQKFQFIPTTESDAESQCSFDTTDQQSITSINDTTSQQSIAPINDIINQQAIISSTKPDNSNSSGNTSMKETFLTIYRFIFK
jgi:hypothetical protein